HFNIPPRLPFEPSARTHLVQISVEIKLQQIPRIVRRPPRRFRLNLRKPQPCKVKAIHKGIYDPNRAIQRDHLVQCLRVKRRLITRLPNHVRHLAPESISASQNPAPKGGFCTAWKAGTTPTPPSRKTSRGRGGRDRRRRYAARARRISVPPAQTQARDLRDDRRRRHKTGWRRNCRRPCSFPAWSC